MPKSLQPNKSILLKAIDDANSSIQQNSGRKSSYNNNNNNNDSNDDQRSSSTSIKSRLGGAVSRHDRHDERRKNYSRINLKLSDTDEREEKRIDNNNENKSVNRRTIELSENTDTKFIVTLKGINEKEFLSNKMEDDDDHNISLKRRLSDDVDEVNEDIEMNEEVFDENNSPAKRIKIRCVYWPSCDKGDNCPYLHPNKPCE